ncbi:MAG TPA: cytochrome c1 [Burkholderiales bacterium]|jgi:ubiquinol-cytochrome c reductase cytochrome c1 subunit|nr:cytochrome c1 [Burkholderiales bacterium]
MRNLLAALLASPALLFAAEVGHPLDHAPIEPRDLISLQSGAHTFVNYCLGCHGLQYMRYNRLTDLGLTEAQIRDNLMFSAEKVGETMKIAMTVKDGKAWFGVPPPDLSVISRARGADWLYTYLRTFYRDPKSAHGWNNKVFPNAAMPHALWKVQAGQSAVQYDTTVRDLVNFLVYVGEPSAQSRKNIGIVVLFVLGLLFILAYAMKKAFWKDVR